MDLSKILSDHKQWLTGKGGTRADLSDADLRGANLGGAYLRGANLGGANLPVGVKWGQIAPVGQGRRSVMAWRIGDQPAQIAGGCFLGTFTEFRAKVTADTLPWDWALGTPEQIGQWRRECLAAADFLELAVSP